MSKRKHSKTGLLNILFMPGASGTFLASMIAKAITDPWWEDYKPEPPDSFFKVTNEYINQYHHVAMAWHPFDKPLLHMNLDKADSLFNLKDVCWINLTITKEEAKFTNIMSAVKQQHYEGVTKEEILDRLFAKDNPYYDKMHDYQSEIALELAKKNKVLNVKWSEIFVDGNTNTILSILNLLFKGQYNSMPVIQNIADQCIAKHDTDKHIYNELKFDPYSKIDYILSQIITEEPNSS